MFTICLFMFWLHTVVLSKTRKLQFILRRHYRHICTVFNPSNKINSSRHNNIMTFEIRYYRVSQKHGNSVTNSISSLLCISIVIPIFKSHNIFIFARVYFMKRVKDCKDVFIMSPQDEQWRRTSLFCLYTAIFFFY